jgi:hypothetical protein
MMHEFGSVQQFLEDFDRGALDKMKIAKKKRDFAASADKRAIYRRNMELMDLVSGVRPAPSEFKLTTGKPDKAAFGKFCHELLFKSITNTLDEWFEPFERAAA